MSVAAVERRSAKPERTGAQNFAQLFTSPQFNYERTSKVEIDIYRSVSLGRSPQIGMLIVEPGRTNLKLKYEHQSEESRGFSWEASIGHDGFIQSVLHIGRESLDDILSLLVDTEAMKGRKPDAPPGKPEFQRLAVDLETMEPVSFIHVERVQAFPKTGE